MNIHLITETKISFPQQGSIYSSTELQFKNTSLFIRSCIKSLFISQHCKIFCVKENIEVKVISGLQGKKSRVSFKN